MKIKISSVLSLDNVLTSLSKEKLPLPTAYKLAKVKAQISEDVAFYQQRARQIIELCAERDDEGKIIMANEQSIKIKPDKIEECNSKMAELDNMIIDGPETTLKLAELGAINLTITQMEQLLPIITE